LLKTGATSRGGLIKLFLDTRDGGGK